MFDNPNRLSGPKPGSDLAAVFQTEKQNTMKECSLGVFLGSLGIFPGIPGNIPKAPLGIFLGFPRNIPRDP